MTNILTQISERKRIEIEQTKLKCSFSSLEKIIQDKKNSRRKMPLYLGMFSKNEYSPFSKSIS